MKYIDIHAHLDHDRFKEDLDEVIERCRKNEVNVICSGVNPVTNKIALEIAEKYPEVVRVSFGLYPLDALEFEINSGEGGFQREVEGFDVDEELEFLKKNKDKFVAVGEIGLDYNWDETRNFEEMKNKQKENFRKVLRVAKEIKKPVVVHTRKAELDCIEILEEEIGFIECGGSEVGVPHNARSASLRSPTQISEDNDLRKINSTQLPDEKKDLINSKAFNSKVVLHCFQGKKSLIKRAVENGWYFSVPPVIMRLDHFKMLVETVPLGQLLTETDSPYLSPERGERNEPCNVKITIGEIARIKDLDEEVVREKILENARGVFGL